MDNRLKVSVLSVTVSIMLLASLIPAQALTPGFVIDFETFSNGNIINTQMAAQIPNGPTGLGVTIYGDNFLIDPDSVDPGIAPQLPDLSPANINLAVIFDSDQSPPSCPPSLPFVCTLFDDNDLLATIPGQSGFVSTMSIPASGYFPGNLLIIQDDTSITTSGNCTATQCTVADDEGNTQPLSPNGGGAGAFIFVFTQPVVVRSLDVFDIQPSEMQPVDILFFDVNGNYLNQFFATILQTGGDNTWREVPLNAVGVKTMVIEIAGSGAIDNIVYDLPIGGTVLPVDITSLFVATASTNPFSILLALGAIGLAGIGTIYLSKTRK